MLLSLTAQIETALLNSSPTPILREKRMPHHPVPLTPCCELCLEDHEVRGWVLSQKRGANIKYITVHGPRVCAARGQKKERDPNDRWPRTCPPAGRKRRMPIALHRWICHDLHDPPPSDAYEATHLCGNQACIAGEHLRWRLKRDNLHDQLFHLTTPPLETQEGPRRFTRRT